ncbi:MAG: PHA/PHB synthase family protein [Parvularculaceae bacterium]
MDRAARAGLGRVTGGVSPAAIAAAYFDWATHLAFSPGKQLQLARKAAEKSARFWNYALRCGIGGSGECCIEPLPQDRRFRHEAWRAWPFNLMSQGFLLTQQWWHNATTGVRGVTEQHERVLDFATRQLLDIVSPSNFILTNPEVLERTQSTAGANLLLGWRNFAEDIERTQRGKPPVGAEAYKVGETVAATPGVVVYRNRLIELIQYAPTTEKVRAEPILIVPAWIMKYYILDLSPQNSLVKFLIDRGHTVFMVSWKNPGADDRDLGFDDYRRLGVMAALDAINIIAPDVQVHGVGYCLGGTLLGVAAADMARGKDESFKSLTFLASQFDFSEAGELSLYINESQVAFLEDVMWEQGYLDAKQMAGAFQLLRSNDLIWSRIERDYLMGERRPMSDLMAWNADATRMPFKMHSEYLRRFYLKNDFAEGRFEVDGDPVSLHDIRTPIFCVATLRDHVAPWRSVYKVHMLADTEVTFLLAGGGHNAGIVSEPGRPGQNFKMRRSKPDEQFVDAEQWLAAADVFDGAWWPSWVQWLDERSGALVEPPAPLLVAASREGLSRTNGVLAPAPGVYVLAA